jgi:phosphoserine phosphatase
MAAIASILLPITMSSRDLHDENRGLRRILDVARRLAAPFELRELLAQIIDCGRDILRADRGSVFLYDDKTRELYLFVAHGVKEIRFSIDKGIAGQCARDRRIINVPDCYADPRFNQEIDKQTGYRTQGLIAMPLIGLDDELVGVLQLLNAADGRFSDNDEYLADMLAHQAATAIQRVRLLSDHLERSKLERELDVARTIQMGVLPKALPTLAGYDLAGASTPASQTGGDIYDVVPLPDVDGAAQRLFLLLADATGHGVGPALSVTQVRGMTRLALRLGAPLQAVFAQVNRQLCTDLSSERFVTAFFGMVDPARHEVTYISAGQAPLLLYRAATNTCESIHASTLPLGIIDCPQVDEVKPMSLAPGDCLILLTDGFFECQNPQGEQMGAQRVGEVIKQHHDAPAQAILDAIVAAMKAFTCGAPLLDDITALIVKRIP